MKIDIHTHTRKIKSGDPNTREIDPQRFGEIIRNTEVKILAITNHNFFDLVQYRACSVATSGICDIWPGIELDILENGRRAHLLVIADPEKVETFNERIERITKNTNPDAFTISIGDTVAAFDDLDCIYIAHYHTKKPSLSDKEIEILTQLTSNPKRILKEAANAISAGIYISHGHNSIFGSDVQDWEDYVRLSEELPDLRLPVESFEQFCLLLEKDEATIITLLDKKMKENIDVTPFGVAEMVRVDIYNDINVFFGSKGTGKTQILEALSTYFNGRGHKTSVYKSNDRHVNDVFDVRGNQFAVQLSSLGIDECKEEIAFLKQATEEEVTSVIKYYQHYAVQETNKNSLRLKIKSIAIQDDAESDRNLTEVGSLTNQIKEFGKFLQDNDSLKKYVDEGLIGEAIVIIGKISASLRRGIATNFNESKSIKLLNHIVKVFIAEISKKTGQPEKPTKTGFADYAKNRIKIEMAVRKILENINASIAQRKEYIGSLGEKGSLYCQTNLKIQNGHVIDSNYRNLGAATKKPQKNFAWHIESISKHLYHVGLFEKITELNDEDGSENINCVSDLLLFYRHFCLNGEPYSPSNGESSMILLHKELKEDKEIYFLDEPEKSLGNDYINDVIVPLLKEKALMGKKVIIATHDANIAVRTLPYNSVYRLHDSGHYFTFCGNPFSNTLKCVFGSKPDLDWKEISMKTLEGGRQAFGERGKIYGSK
jgi:predicted ATPase